MPGGWCPALLALDSGPVVLHHGMLSCCDVFFVVVVVGVVVVVVVVVIVVVVVVVWWAVRSRAESWGRGTMVCLCVFKVYCWMLDVICC